MITWEESKDMHIGILQINGNLKQAIQEQLKKVFILAESKSDWDCIIMDICLYNQGHLICYIQDKEQALGLHKGFKVTLQIEKYRIKLDNIKESNLKYKWLLTELKESLIQEIKQTFLDKDFLISFDELWRKNKFVVRFAYKGILERKQLKFA